MLDVPLRRGQDVIGVLCVEHVGGPRVWTVDEQNFAISTANLIAVAIADERRREALSQVAQSDARAHLILDTAHDAFIGMDADSRIVNWNAQAEKVFGWTREEALGRNLAETIIPPAFREAHLKGMKRFLATGEAPVVNRRLELRGLHQERPRIPDRNHHHAADAAGRWVFLRRVPARHLRSAAAGRGADAAPRTLPRRRRARRASSWPT